MVRYVFPLFAIVAFSQLSADGAEHTEKLPSVPTKTPVVRHPQHFAVRLQVDGNLVGRLRLRDSIGMQNVVRGSVSFSKDGSQAKRAQVDESGHFQLVGLIPGFYHAAANYKRGTTHFGVHVMPFDGEAAPSEMILDATVSDPQSLERVLGEDDVAQLDDAYCEHCDKAAVPIADACATSSCGGFCGSQCCGHRKWGLLGLAGLAGLAGLDDDDDPGPIASPFR